MTENLRIKWKNLLLKNGMILIVNKKNRMILIVNKK